MPKRRKPCQAYSLVRKEELFFFKLLCCCPRGLVCACRFPVPHFSFLPNSPPRSRKHSPHSPRTFSILKPFLPLAHCHLKGPRYFVYLCIFPQRRGDRYFSGPNAFPISGRCVTTRNTAWRDIEKNPAARYHRYTNR